MNIREIRVEGFGALRDRTIGLQGPVTVFYGPNEAGKSTLLHLIRAVLFGFPPRGQAAERFEPPAGGAHGGALTLETVQGEPLRVARRSGSAAGGRGRSPSAGIVSVTLADGTAGGEELLRELLGGVSGEQFRNLFAFTLTELQELRTLTSGELGGFLHSAGLGVRAAAVAAAERRLTQELDARFKPRGKSQGIGRLLADADQLEADWRRSLALAGRYNAMAEELDRLADEIAAEEEELRGLRERRGFLESAASVRDRWLRHRSVVQELAELPGHRDFPEDGVKRQEALLQELEQRTVRLQRLEEARAQQQARVRSYTEADARLLAGRDKLDSLMERLGVYKNGFALEAEIRAEREGLEEQLRSKLEGLGLHVSDVDTVSRLPITLEDQAEAKRWKDRSVEEERRRHLLSAELEGLDRSLREAESRTAERHRELETHRKRLVKEYPSNVRELAALLPSLIRELRRDRTEADGLKRDLRYAEERELEHKLQLEQLQAAEMNSASGFRPALAGLGYLALMASAGLAAMFFFMNEMLLAGGSLVLLGGMGAAILLLLRGSGKTRGMTADRSAGISETRGRSRSSGATRSDAMADGPLAAKRRELTVKLEENRKRIREKLQGTVFHPETAASGTQSGYWLRAVSHPEDENLPDILEQQVSEMVKELQEADRLEERWKEARRISEELAVQRAETEQELERLEAESIVRLEAWKQWLVDWGIQLELPPAFAPDLLVELEQSRQLTERVNRLTDQLTGTLEDRRLFEADCRNVSGLVDGSEHRELPVLIQLRKQDMEQAAGRYARMQEATDALEELEQELREEGLAAERIREKLVALWRQAGVENEEQFRKSGAELMKSLLLEEERKALSDLVAAGVGGDRTGELDMLFARWGEFELSEEIARLDEQMEELSRHLDRSKEQKGRLSADCGKLLEGSEHRNRQDRLEELKTRFRDEASQWAVYAMAAGLLRKARETYERERQPGVLRQASEHFRRLTGGRYERVIATFGEQRLVALRADGEAVESSRLSRGTAEQLYLSIRFALAAEFARKTPLPLIMDDIFVNFDRQRLEASVHELRFLAENHQILVFTCHSHIRDTIQSVIQDVQVIEL